MCFNCGTSFPDFERRLRHAPQQSQSGVDPLTELARLVAMDDPFKSMFDDMSAKASALPHTANMSGAAAEYAGHAPYYDAAEENFDPQPRGIAEEMWRQAQEQQAASDLRVGAPASQLAAPRAQDAGYEQGRFDSRPGDMADQTHIDDEALVAYPPAPLKGRRMPRKAMIAGLSLSVVAIASVAAAIGFRGLPSSRSAQDTPLIKAALGPAKVQAPQSAAGGDATAAASVLDKGGSGDGAGNAKLVSHEEQPSDIAAPVKTVRVGDIGTAAQAGNGVAAAPSPAVATMPEPKRVKTVLVRPDGSIIGEPPVRPAAGQSLVAVVPIESGLTPTPKTPQIKAPLAKAADAIAAVIKPLPVQTAVVVPVQSAAKTTTRIIAAAPARPAQVAEAKDAGAELGTNAPLQLAPAHGKPVKVAARDVPVAPVPDETTQATSSTTGGGFAVQLAAPASEQEAKDTSARLQKQYAGALGAYQPSIRKASDKDVFRVRVVNLSKDEADALCGKLKAAGGGCFVARN